MLVPFSRVCKTLDALQARSNGVIKCKFNRLIGNKIDTLLLDWSTDTKEQVLMFCVENIASVFYQIFDKDTFAPTHTAQLSFIPDEMAQSVKDLINTINMMQITASEMTHIEIHIIDTQKEFKGNISANLSDMYTNLSLYGGTVFFHLPVLNESGKHTRAMFGVKYVVADEPALLS